MKLCGAAELLRSGVRMALREGGLTQGVGKRGQGVGMAGGGRDARQSICTGPCLTKRFVACEEARSPAKAPNGVVMVFAATPAIEKEAAVRPGIVEVALALIQPGEHGGAVHAHRNHIEAHARLQTLHEKRARAGRIAPERADRSKDAVRDQGGVRVGVGGTQVIRDLHGPVPVAQLAQHVGHAAEAGVLHSLATVRLAEAEGGRECVPGAAVVAGDLVRRAQTLVHLRRLEGQLVFERQRKPGLDGLHSFVELAALDARDPFESQGPGAQIGPLRTRGLLTGAARQLNRVAVKARAVNVAGGDQPLGRGFAWEAVGGEGVGRDAAGSECPLAISLELVDRRQPTLGVGKCPAGALGAPGGNHLALRAGRLGQLARQLGVRAVRSSTSILSAPRSPSGHRSSAWRPRRAASR